MAYARRTLPWGYAQRGSGELPLKGRVFKIEILSRWRLCGKSLVCGPGRAESPASPEPRATPWVPCPHSLRPVRAKAKANRSPMLLPLQGVGVCTLIPRALPWAGDWLPFQGAPFALCSFIMCACFASCCFVKTAQSFSEFRTPPRGLSEPFATCIHQLTL